MITHIHIHTKQPHGLEKYYKIDKNIGTLCLTRTLCKVVRAESIQARVAVELEESMLQTL